MHILVCEQGSWSPTLRASVLAMRALTGLDNAGWALAGLYFFALVLILRSRTAKVDGTRVRGVLIAPALLGLVLVAAFGARYWSDTLRVLRLMPKSKWGVVVSLGAAFVALAVVELLLTTIAAVPALLRMRARPHRLVSDLAVTAAVAVCAVAGYTLLSRLHAADAVPPLGPGEMRVRASYAIGAVTDIEFRSSRDGYVALDDGRIAHFVLAAPPDESFRLGRSAHGLQHPRGLAILGNRLFVSELGPLPCRQKPCLASGDASTPSTEAGDKRYLARARGRVVAFTIRPDGELVDRRVVLSGLPVSNMLHGVNGLTRGPDGLLYLSIGNLDALYRHPQVANGLTPRPGLLGTVVRFAPDGSRLQVVADGLRNVYDLTFDEQGNLWGVDNDGPTLRGWRAEELLLIRPHGHYGYPYEGTFAPSIRRKIDPPVWILPGIAGSAAIEWAPRLGLEPGIVDGSCAELTYITLPLDRRRSALTFRPSIRSLIELPACVSVVKPGPDHTAVVGLYAGGGNPSLYVLAIGQ